MTDNETATYAAANANNNKVIFDGNVLIDLTADTATPSKVLKGSTFHDASGAIQTGTCTFDSDTKADTATADEILAGKTAHSKGSKVTGTMKNNGAVKGSISTVAGQYTVPQGFHDGSGKVGILAEEQAKIVPENIREGIVMLGVTGTMSGLEEVKAEAPTVTPKAAQQVVTPGEGYNYLSQVTVAAIPYSETDNSAGGKTVAIG